MSDEDCSWSSSIKAILASVPFSYENETLPTSSIVVSLLSEKDLQLVIRILVENESSILNHDEEYELFYSSYTALATHHLCAGVNSLSKSSLNNLEKACKVLLSFFLNRLQKKFENSPITKKQLTVLIKSLCKGTSHLPKSDLTVFITQLKFAKAPPDGIGTATSSGASVASMQLGSAATTGGGSSSGSPQKPSKVVRLERSGAYEQMLSVFREVASNATPVSAAATSTSAAPVSLQPSSRSRHKKSHSDAPSQPQLTTGGNDGGSPAALTAAASTATAAAAAGRKLDGVGEMEMQEAMAVRNLTTLQRQLRGNDVLLEVCSQLQSLKKFEVVGFCGSSTGKDLVWPTSVGEALPVVARLQQVAADISIVWRLFSLPIFEPLTRQRLRTVVTIATSCLNAAISATLATSIVSVTTSTPSKGASVSKDEEVDGHTASVVQKSLDVFNWVSRALEKSSKAGGHVSQNYHLMGAWSLLKGLQSLLFLNLSFSTDKGKESGGHKAGKSPGDSSGAPAAKSKDSKDGKEMKDVKETKDSKGGKDSKESSQVPPTSSAAAASKPQIVFGPLYVALTNQALRLLSGLIGDLEVECMTSLTETEIKDIGDEIQLFEDYTALQRVRKLTKAVYFSNLFHFLVSQFFKKGMACSKTAQQKTDKATPSSSAPTTAPTATATVATTTTAATAADSEKDEKAENDGSSGQERGRSESVDAESSSSDSNTFYEEDFSSSQEDISYEEEDSEPILGQWFEETLSPLDVQSDSHDVTSAPNPDDVAAGSAKSSKHPRRHSNTESAVTVPDKKEPEAYLKLVTDILNFTIQHFVESPCSELVDYFGSTLTEDHICQLANLVKELDSEFGSCLASTPFEGISRSLSCFIHLLINKGLLTDSLQMIFLDQLGLNISSKGIEPPSTSGQTMVSWPLNIKPRALSVLAEIFLKKHQQHLSISESGSGITSDSPSSAPSGKKGLGWPTAVQNVWNKFLKSLTFAIVSQSSVNLDKEFVECDDVNAEHVQLLLFLFYNLSLMEKKTIWIHLCSCVIKVNEAIKSRLSLTNPLLTARLLMIVDCLLHCFYEAQPLLNEKVANSLFGIFTGTFKESSERAEEDEDQRYFLESNMEMIGRSSEGEETFGPSSSSSSDQRKESLLLFQTRPKFYRLRRIDGSPDVPKIDGLASSFLLSKNDTIDYDMFYDSVLSLLNCGQGTTGQPSVDSSNVKDVLKRAACRKYHLITGLRLLSSLPPSVAHLRQVEKLEESSCDELTCYHVTRWMLKLNLQSYHAWVKEGLVKQGLTNQAADELLESLTRLSGKYSSYVHWSKQILLRQELITDGSFLDVFHLCCFDLVITGLRAMIESRFQVGQKLWLNDVVSADSADFDSLLAAAGSALQGLFATCEEFLFKMASKNSKDSSSSSSPSAVKNLLRIGFSNNHFITEHFAEPASSLYPSSVKTAVDKWNDSGLGRFSEQLLPNNGDSLDAHLDKLQKTHLCSITGYPTIVSYVQLVMPSLKRALFSLTSLVVGLIEFHAQLGEKSGLPETGTQMYCHALTNYMPELAKDMFEKVLANDGSSSSSSSSSEKTSTPENKMRETVMHRLLVVCHQVILEYIGGEMAKKSGEETAVECLACLESIADKLVGKKVIEEFYLLHSDDLFSLLMSAGQKRTSFHYRFKVFKYFNKLLQLASSEESTTAGIRQVVCTVLGEMASSETPLSSWLSHVVVPPGVPSVIGMESTDPHFLTLKSQFSSFVSLVKNAKLMDTIGAQLLHKMAEISQSLFPPRGDSSLFPELLNLMVTVASTLDAPTGLQDLFSYANQWTNVLSSSLSDAKTPPSPAPSFLDDTDLSSERHQVMDSMCCLFQVMRDSLVSKHHQLDRASSPTPADGLAGSAPGTTFLSTSSSPPVLDLDSDDDDDDSNDEEEEEDDEESLANKLCTYTITQKEFMNQHWYHCHTCKMVDGVGVCTICAKVCHKDHDISYSKYGSFFCDCGAKEDNNKCMALTKRSFSKEHKDRQKQQQQQKRLQQQQKQQTGYQEQTSKKTPLFFPLLQKDDDKSSTPSNQLQEASQLVKKATNEDALEDDSCKARQQDKEVFFKILSEKKTIENLVKLLDQLQPIILNFYNRLSPGGYLAKSQKAIKELHELPKTNQNCDSLMVGSLGSQEGTLENIKMTYSGDQGQTIRQLLASHVLRRAAVGVMTSPFGRRQLLAVCGEKGKVSVLQLSTLLKQVGSSSSSATPSGKRKFVLPRLGGEPVPFTVLGVFGCPSNEDLLAVCGLKDCHVLTFTPIGGICDHMVLHLALESGNFIIKAIWLPGSQTELAVVTADFVKIYNLSQDAISPQYYFLLPAGKIRDVTFACSESRDVRHVIIMSSTGYIYSQILDDSSSAKTGVFFITNVVEVNHPDLQDAGGQVAGGGASVYYSHSLQMLFFSYTQGKNFVGPLGKDLGSVKHLFLIVVRSSNGGNSSSGSNNSKSSSGSNQQQQQQQHHTLVQWTEVHDHPGLVSCFLQLSNTPVVLFIEPETIFIQEIKLAPSKAKIQDMVLIRHAANSPATSATPTAGVATSAAAGGSAAASTSLAARSAGTSDKRTSLILVFDDGSLRILTAESRLTDYWMMTHTFYSDVGPTQPSSVAVSKLPLKIKKKVAGHQQQQQSGRPTGQVTFLVDFFEHCQVLNEVEFGGNDILQFYNVAQIKTRLNTTGMYIASNKAGGFSLEVTNVTASNVMVGMRVLVGSQSVDRAPSYIEMFGRKIQVNLTRHRWYDIPFSREESLTADKNFTITFGQSRDGNGITMVDSVKVYSKTKDSFGWPEDVEDMSLEVSKVIGRNAQMNDVDGQASSSATPTAHATGWSAPGPLDRFLVKSMELLEDCFVSCRSFFEQKQLKKTAQNVATSILVMPTSVVVQQKAKSLLASLFNSKSSFHWHVDQTHLLMLIKCLDQFEESGSLQFDSFQKLLPLVASITSNRPSNFQRFYNTWKQQRDQQQQDPQQKQHPEISDAKNYMNLSSSETCHLSNRLSSAFWHLVSLQVDNPLTLPVFALGVTHVDSTVSSLVVILHGFLSLDGPDVLPLLSKLFVRMLLSENQQVSYSCKQALLKIYKPPVPVRSSEAASNAAGQSVQRRTSQIDAESQQKLGDEADRAAREQQQQENAERQQEAAAVDLMSSAAAVPEFSEADLVGEAGNIQAYLDADDETMVQLAIALSLQDQSGSSSSPGGGAGTLPGEIHALGVQLQAAASHLSEVAAANQASDDEAGSNLAAEGSALPISPAEPRVGPGASESSGSNAGSVSVSGRSSVTAEMVVVETSAGSIPLDANQVSSSSTIVPGSSVVVMPTEEEESTLKPAKEETDGEKWHRHCMKMLRQFVGSLSELRDMPGSRAVPFLQFIMALVFEADPIRDSSTLDFFLTRVVEEIDVDSTATADESSPSDAASLVVRSQRWEVKLLLLRMLSVMMSRSSGSGGSEKATSSDVAVTESSVVAGSSSVSAGKTSAVAVGSEVMLSTLVGNHLKKKGLLNFCLKYLQFLLSSNYLNFPSSSSHPTSKDQTAESGPKLGQLLKPRQLTPPPDLSPFFLKQYAKSHATDIFEDFHQLLVEILLRIPYQMKKLCGSLKFGAEWHSVLAEYMITNQVPFVKKQVRKLLLYVCGSKEKYRLERDLHFLEKHMGSIREVCLQKETSPTAVSYDVLIVIIDHLKSCLEVATTRTLNWQKYCQKSKSLLSFLIQSSVTLDEGVAPLLLQLLQFVLCGDVKAADGSSGGTQSSKSSGKSSSAKKEKRTSENSDNESVHQQQDEGLCALLAQQVCSMISQDLLSRFIICFLLESNQTSVRWQAHSLVLNIYRNSLADQRENLIDLMWNIWPDLHVYGSKAAQFVDLLGYFTIKTTHISDTKLKSYVERALLLMRNENKISANHPNGGIYNTLEGLVDFDGYYLERDPCLVCNNPEVPFSTLKLSTVKVDSKFTTSCQIVKLVGSHTISKFMLRITDIKKSKMVKTLVVYYNNKQVQAILELKNKPALWHKAKKVTLNPNQTEVKVEFSLPIVACNLMIEFADFYDNMQASTETLQCPRCSASVPANPGVCNNCGENVFQCHKCRAINYDERDPFLCNSCGFCKYAKFDFNMVARQCCAVDPIENDEDRKKAVTTINNLLENADVLYKQLQSLKTTLDGLLIKVTDHHTTSGTGFFDLKDDQTASSAAPPAAAATTTTTAASSAAASNVVAASIGSINKSLQQLAIKYCGDCRMAFDDLSKIIQKVLATRKELVDYDRQQQETAMLTSSSMTLTSSVTSFVEMEQPVVVGGGANGTSSIVNPALISSRTFSTSSMTMRQSQVFKNKEKKIHCYGCSSASVEHCITLLRAMSTNGVLKDYLCGQGLIQELFDYNLRRGSAVMRSEVRHLLCLMSTQHHTATEELLKLLHGNVEAAMKGHFSNPDFASAVRHEMCLLGNLLQIEDNLWEQRLRCVMKLFMTSVKYDSPSVQDCVSLPCLRIFQHLIKPLFATTTSAATAKGKKDKSSETTLIIQPPINLTANLSAWMDSDPSASYNSWRASLPTRAVISDGTSGKKRKEDKSVGGGGKDGGEKKTVRMKMLSEKYFNRWRYNVKLGNRRTTSLKIIDRTWMKKAMFSPTSSAMRQTECNIIESICKVPGRKQDVIDVLSSCLEEVGNSGEASAEFLILYKKLISSDHWKYYVALKGVLNKITLLITKEINELQRLESFSLSSDLSQGFALKSLTDLLSTLLEVDSIKQQYKNKLVGSILDGYLSLRKLVVQRTKMIDDTQDKLLELLEEMTTGTESETKEFMAVCVETVNKYPLNDTISPVFIFERLCNTIYPEATDSREFTMSLEKEPQQEDFLQGRMLGNPYSSSEPGLGPLMRDVKNKICQDCELVALLEDDTGMELLVNNKIISLDLPVKDVYRKIWMPDHADNESMRIVYRMRGLLGDATEDMVNSLETGKDSDIDCEVVYKMASVMSQCSGLEVMLQRLASIHNLVTGKQLMVVLLKLFGYCLKVKSNKQELIKIEMNSITIMLGALNLALLAEQETGASTKGQTLTEQILQIMEIILLEASTHLSPEVYKVFSKSCGDRDQLMVLLDRINSSFVRCNSNVLHSLMRLIPFLAYADEEKMLALCNHFKPYLDFDKYDFDHTQDEQVHLDCFCIIAQGIESNVNGRKLKDLILEKSTIVKDTVTYILNHTPSSSGPPVLTENEGWKEMISKPALPFALRLLTGLCKGHDPIKLQLLDIIPALHNLEQISSDERVGSLAENLLEALKENDQVAMKIEDVRQQTKTEKKRMAMAMREKQLDQLGMMTNEKGQVTVKRGILKGQIDVLKEETGLTCCICREGYKNQPSKVLGIYTFTKRINLDDFENKQRKSVGYSTVTHFNIVHFDCHLAAVRHARAREEWESAALQNGNTKCNGLLPLWGPEVPESAFAGCLAKHNGYLQEVTGVRDSNYLHSVHDLKHLLTKFSFEKSFSEDSGGGGRGSNMHLIPYMMHLILYVINTTRSTLREEGNISNFLKFSPQRFIENCYETEGALFHAVLACHVLNPQLWKTNRDNFLKRILLLGHVRHVSPSPCTSIADKEVKDYTVYKPYLMFYQLIDLIYSHLCKSCKFEEGAGKWSSNLADYIRHNDQLLVEGSKKLLKVFEEEGLPCESLLEFFDVAGLLEMTDDPTAWLQDALNTLLP